jgi:uncharacterized integral membrane protein
MRVLAWFYRIVLLVLLFGFAVKNSEVVDLHFFYKQWSLRLAFIILIAFAAGAFLGATATVVSLLRQRREISRLRRQLDRAEHAAGGESAPPPELR